MEQAKKFVATDVKNDCNENSTLMETFDVIDGFLERKLFPFICSAVPLYLIAHLVVMFSRQ
ncbi:MAG: hypothetical protein FH758_03795 [Firmicutes bacterium]|nr:hypothetical protein [Bacillota bacterium]